MATRSLQVCFKRCSVCLAYRVKFTYRSQPFERFYLNGLQQQRLQSTKSTESKKLVLTDDQKSQFENEGYVIVHNVFEKDHIQKMKDTLDECEERAKYMTKSTKHFALDPHHTLDNPMLQRVHIPSLLFPVFEETIRYEPLLDIVEELIGPNIRYVRQDKVNLKIPRGTGFPVKWHQDWAFFPYTNQNMVIPIVAIDDTTRENGCIQVIPKSHKGPLYSHYTDGDFSTAINDSKFDPSSAVHMEFPSGSVSFHHVMIAHGSAANRSDQKRRLYLFQYCSTDAWPLLGVGSSQFGPTGPVDWDLFTSTLLRGKITVFPKMEALPVCIPVPFENTYALESGDRIKSSHKDPE